MPRRVLHDEYFRRAKAEGYLARSAYKLKQIQESKRLLKPGDRVLDLGCAPGAWIQAALEVIGRQGLVVGLDLQSLRVDLGPNVRGVVGDVASIRPEELTGAEGRLFDVVLSDMAPSTSGHGDDLLSSRLCDRVIELLPRLLKPTGNLAMKVLEGGEYPRLLREVSNLFGSCKGFKPKASREVSREMYIVATGFAPRPA